ncbi:MAG: hypothetical protein KAQ99_10325, partial [Candidatus Aureabacteria bacterium]|nr:hypothetical protein [Candidatus Auribacterota bacterium]
NRLTIKDVTVDLSADIEVEMRLGEKVYTLTPECAIDFGLVSETAFYTEHPLYIQGYYKMYFAPAFQATGTKLGKLDFFVAPSEAEIVITDILIEHPVYRLIEKDMIESLIVLAYKAVESKTDGKVETIGIEMSALTEPVIAALDSFEKRKELSFSHASESYRYYTVEPAFKTSKLYATRRGKVKSYNKLLYDGTFTGEGDVVTWWPTDDEGNPIENPAEPGNPLYIFYDNRFQGEDIIIYPEDEMCEFVISGLEFLMPLSTFIDKSPPGYSKFVLNFGHYADPAVLDSVVELDLAAKQVTVKTPVSPIEPVKLSGPTGLGGPNAPPQLAVEKMYCGLPVDKYAKWVWNKIYSMPPAPSATELFNQLDKVNLERVKISSSIGADSTGAYSRSIPETVNYEFKGKVVVRMSPHMMTDFSHTNMPTEVKVYNGATSAGTVNLLEDYGMYGKVKISGALAGNLKESLLIDLKNAPHSGQVVKVDVLVKEGSVYIHEEYCLGRTSSLHSTDPGKVYRIWNKVVGQLWGEDFYYSVTSQHYVTANGKLEPKIWFKSNTWMEPRRLKRLWYKTGRMMAHPLGPAAFVSVIHGAFIGWNYYKGNYMCTDQIYGDVVGAAVDAGIWTTAFRVLAAWGPASATTGFIALMPVMVISHLAVDYSRFVWREWKSGVVVGGFNDMMLDPYANVGLSMYRALFSWYDSKILKRDYELRKQYPYGLRNGFEYIFMEAATDVWVEKNISPSLTAEEIKNVEWGLLSKSGHYVDIFENNITDPIYEGLSWYHLWNVGSRDNYGYETDRQLGIVGFCRDNPYPGVSNVGPPVPVNDIYQKLISGIANAYEKLNGASSEVEPMSFFTGYEYTLMQLVEDAYATILVLMRQMQTKLDNYDGSGTEVATARASVWPASKTFRLWITDDLPPWIQEDYDEEYPSGTLFDNVTAKWIDVRTALNTLEELLVLVKDTDWATVCPEIEYNLIPNPDLEMDDIGDTGFNPVAVETVNGAQSNYTIPDHVTLGGIRYYWDVKAVVEPDISPPSETWEFRAQ